jgi:hypothetical protein
MLKSLARGSLSQLAEPETVVFKIGLDHSVSQERKRDGAKSVTFAQRYERLFT